MTALRVLVVEDDAVMAELLAELLVHMGHVVCGIAATEDGAVAAAALHQPDLMLVDMQLAEGTGTGAILRTAPVPHVLMTGYSPGRASPGAAALRKPFREPDLARAIACALDSPASTA